MRQSDARKCCVVGGVICCELPWGDGALAALNATLETRGLNKFNCPRTTPTYASRHPISKRLAPDPGSPNG